MSYQISKPSGGGSSHPPSTPTFTGSILPLESGSIEIEELPSEYPFTQEREIDSYVRMLGRGRISKDTFLELAPEATRADVAGALKRLYSRGYLISQETQDTIKLFGGWK